MQSLTATAFQLPQQTAFYKGKVRDVYTIADKYIVMVATDRISAFDVVLPRGIPFKGQMLNQLASKFLDLTCDVCPSWKIVSPDPMVTVGFYCKPLPVEMIVRGYLCGSAWRAYREGERELCGVKLPNGMRENQKFPTPVITPTTKAEQGLHDQDISKEEILDKKIVSPKDYELLERYSLALFQRGERVAARRNLILVDTKYEFGKRGDEVTLIDEIHTPDSSRYFYADNYLERFEKGQPQRHLSKEFVREWLMVNNFQGQPGQRIPEMTDVVVDYIGERYLEVFEKLYDEKFVGAPYDNIYERIELSVRDLLSRLLR
ncbi:MAG: phosphoribosylaminoimidazolesuccinocarboxamide synthase [Prevotellaceae bacterium]|nr:phosphoribosylaminoimidazolesuccinocarboxamide synthase [Prevotellaceae bacterium]